MLKTKVRKTTASDHPEYPEMSALDVLGNCEGFREEFGVMQDLVQSYGNIVLFSSKGHPEIAGAGIEYDWGVSKKDFRYNDNHIAKNCKNDVRSSLAKCWKYPQRIQSYVSAPAITGTASITSTSWTTGTTVRDIPDGQSTYRSHFRDLPSKLSHPFLILSTAK